MPNQPHVEIVLQRVSEKILGPGAQIISDKGPQLITKDVKEFIGIRGMTHANTSPYYSQSKSRLERYHRKLKGSCIWAKTPLSLEDAQRIVFDFVSHYNDKRLYSVVDCISSLDKLDGRAEIIFATRENELAGGKTVSQNKKRICPIHTGPLHSGGRCLKSVSKDFSGINDL